MKRFQEQVYSDIYVSQEVLPAFFTQSLPKTFPVIFHRMFSGLLAASCYIFRQSNPAQTFINSKL